MKLRTRFAFFVLLGISLAGVVAYQFRPNARATYRQPEAPNVKISMPTRHEPVYQGRTLSEWLERAQWQEYQGEKSTDAEAAIGKIGTNAVPYLLQMLCYEDSKVSAQMREWILQQNWVPNGWQNRIANRKSERDYREQSIKGFEILGDQASGALPILTNLVSSTNYTIDVLRVLRGMGAPAAPVLVQLLDHTNSDVRFRAFQEIEINTPTEDGPSNESPTWVALETNKLIVLTLIRHFDDDPEFAEYVVELLVNFKAQADLVIPFYLKILNSTNQDFRPAAVEALGKLKAAESVPNLVLLLKDSDRHIARKAALAIERIDRETAKREAIPVLIEAVTDGSDPWDRLVDALARLDPNLAVKTLLKNLQSTNQPLRVDTAFRVGRLKSDNPEKIISALVAGLDDPIQDVRGGCAISLAKFRQKAKAAIPKLLEVLPHIDRANYDRVLFALLIIDPELPPEKLLPLRPSMLNYLYLDPDEKVRKAAARLSAMARTNSVSNGR